MRNLFEKKKDTVIAVMIGCYLLASVVAAVFMTSIGVGKCQHMALFSGDAQIQTLSEGWVLNTGEEELPLLLPSRNEYEIKNGQAVLTNKLPHYIGNQHVILVRSSLQKIDVSIDGTKVYSYGASDYIRYGRNMGSAWNFIPLSEEYAEKEIEITLTSPYKAYESTFNAVYIGTYPEAYSLLFKEHGNGLILSMALLVMGLFMILLFGACYFLKISRNTQTLWLGLFAAAVAVWEITECKLTQLAFYNVVWSSNLGFVVLMLMIVPLVLYFDEVQNHEFLKLHMPIVAMAELNCLIQILIQFIGSKDFYEMVPATHVIIILGTIEIIITSLISYKRKQERTLMTLMAPLVILAAAGVGEMINLYVTGLTSGVFLSMAVFIYVLYCGVRTMLNMLTVVMEGLEAQRESAAKTMFLANMSHEIRTPMNAICAMSEMLLQSETIPLGDKGSAKVIHESAHNLLDIINDILDYTKISSDKMEINDADYNIHKLIYDACSPIVVIARQKNLDFTALLAPDTCVDLYGDDGKVRQLLINLLSNAVKYTEKGSVTLLVESEDLSDDRVRVKFSVVDTGIGIKKSEQEKLFDAFSQVNPRKQRYQDSTGLGLAIAKGITKLMAGDITVKSTEGAGSTFTATIVQKKTSNLTYYRYLANQSLPVQYIDGKLMFNPPEGQEWAGEDENLKLDASRAVIMVVDDNSTNLRIMREMLGMFEVSPILISSGKQALKAVEVRKPDLIFMDHMMPEMDGIETTEMIRNMPDGQGRNIKIVALTANAMKGAEEELMSHSFDGYLSKPVSLKQIRNMLVKQLDPKLYDID